jgi:hypothetical protein
MHPVEARRGRGGGEARRSEGRITSDLGRAAGPSSAMRIPVSGDEAVLNRTVLQLGARSGGKYLARRTPLEGSGERSREIGGGGEEMDWRRRSLSFRNERETPSRTEPASGERKRSRNEGVAWRWLEGRAMKESP